MTESTAVFYGTNQEAGQARAKLEHGGIAAEVKWTGTVTGNHKVLVRQRDYFRAVDLLQAEAEGPDLMEQLAADQAAQQIACGERGHELGRDRKLPFCANCGVLNPDIHPRSYQGMLLLLRAGNEVEIDFDDAAILGSVIRGIGRHTDYAVQVTPGVTKFRLTLRRKVEEGS